jgi:serine/threonine-protein kinase
MPLPLSRVATDATAGRRALRVGRGAGRSPRGRRHGSMALHADRAARRGCMPDVIADRYELREIIGRGASGVVCEAVDRRLHRLVAVKLMRGTTHADERERMLREAQVTGRLTHGNIVTVHDAGMADDLFFIVMELVIGEPLGAPMRRGEIGQRDALAIAADLLDALAHAHARGVVHRDVKPANVLMAQDERPGPGTAKLTDFGIARTAASDLTRLGTMAGTPAYMSPEALRGEEVDARTDLWGVGVVLYEMLARRHPFRPPAEFFALAHAIVNTPPPPIEALAPGLPAGIAGILDVALAKHRENRFPDAATMAATLRRALAEMPAGAAPPPPGIPAEAGDDATLLVPRLCA